MPLYSFKSVSELRTSLKKTSCSWQSEISQLHGAPVRNMEWAQVQYHGPPGKNLSWSCGYLAYWLMWLTACSTCCLLMHASPALLYCRRRPHFKELMVFLNCQATAHLIFIHRKDKIRSLVIAHFSIRGNFLRQRSLKTEWPLKGRCGRCRWKVLIIVKSSSALQQSSHSIRAWACQRGGSQKDTVREFVLSVLIFSALFLSRADYMCPSGCSAVLAIRCRPSPSAAVQLENRAVHPQLKTLSMVQWQKLARNSLWEPSFFCGSHKNTGAMPESRSMLCDVAEFKGEKTGPIQNLINVCNQGVQAVSVSELA